jgi:hypothetical protein
MGNADTLHLAFFIEVIEDPVGHDNDIALFARRSSFTGGSVLEGNELGIELDEHEVALGKKVAQLKDFPGVLVEGAVVCLEPFGAVEYLGGGIRAVSVIEVLYGDIRGKVTRYLIIPFIIKVVDVFQVLLAVHGIFLLKLTFA